MTLTLEELRSDPDFLAAAKQADPPLDLDGVKEVLYAGTGLDLEALLLLEDGRPVALLAKEGGRAFYGRDMADLAAQLLRALGKGEG